MASQSPNAGLLAPAWPVARGTGWRRAIAATTSLLSALARWMGEHGAAALLIPSPLAGLVLFAALALQPSHLVGALVGALMGDLVARFTTNPDDPRVPNIRSNGVLGGLGAAWLIAPGGLLLSMGLVFIPVVAALTALVAAALGRALGQLSVPILAAGFMVVFGIELTLFPGLAANAATAELIWAYPAGAEGWVESLLRSAGMMLFDPQPLTGAIVLLALAVGSPILLAHGLLGWVVGIGMALLLQSLGFSWKWLLSAHNAFLSAALVGAVFHLPTRTSLLLSAVAGVLATLFALVTQIAFSGTAWAFQPIPGMATIWILLLAFSGRDPARGLVPNRELHIPPHEAARHYRETRARFGPAGALLIPPVAGRLLVTQGFDGTLSHRGQWRHALDFERPETEATIFGATVFAPCAGIVERVQDGVVDNFPGTNNYRNNWGNHVVIRMDRGGWALLAHLAQGSLCVVTGQRVEYGTVLGVVGNSGRSIVSHLHMSVITGPEPGSPTLPFRLANVTLPDRDRPTWHAHYLPHSGQIVAGAAGDPVVLGATASISPGVATWRLQSSGKLPRNTVNGIEVESIRVGLDSAGRHVFSMSDDVLIFHADADAMRLYSAPRIKSPTLTLLGLALPLVPYASGPGTIWRDVMMAQVGDPRERVAQLLAPYGYPADRFVRLRMLESGSDGVLIESEIDRPRAHEPHIVRVRLVGGRGPVEIDARYGEGRVIAQMVAFEPRLV